jgi:hypothetical protein
VTEYGICIATNPNPTINNRKVVLGSGIAGKMDLISGLILGTRYSIRGYAINSYGVSYGREIAFSTLRPVDNQSLSLDGIDDYGQILKSFFSNNFQRNFTIEFFGYFEANQTRYVGVWGKTGFWTEINVHLFDPGKLNFLFATNVNGQQYFSGSPIQWIAQEWAHYAVVGDGNSNQIRTYKNGRLIGTTNLGTPNWSIPNNDSKIGAVFQGWTAPNTQYLKGKIDDFRVSDIPRYNSNFDPPKNISNDQNTMVLYNFNKIENNLVLDLSNNSNHLYLRNGATISPSSPY